MSKGSKGNSSFYDQEKSIFVGGLHSKVTEEILWELFLQAGPLENVRIPKDKVTGQQRSFGFVTYQDACSISYACELFDTLKLFGRSISCKPQNAPKRSPNSPEIDRVSYTSTPNGNREHSYQHDDRGHSRPNESQFSRDKSPYNRNTSRSIHPLQRSISSGVISPLLGPLLAQKLYSQHIQNQLFNASPNTPQHSHQNYGPIRRYNSLYDRSPSNSRMQRRQRTHPY